MKCGVRSVKGGVGVKCGLWNTKCRLVLPCNVMIIDQNGAAGSHKARTHGPGWRTAHTSSIDEKGLIG